MIDIQDKNTVKKAWIQAINEKFKAIPDLNTTLDYIEWGPSAEKKANVAFLSPSFKFVDFAVDILFDLHENNNTPLVTSSIEQLYQFYELEKLYSNNNTSTEIKNSLLQYFKILSPKFNQDISNELFASMDERHDIIAVRPFMCQEEIIPILQTIVEKNKLLENTIILPQNGEISNKGKLKI